MKAVATLLALVAVAALSVTASAATVSTTIHGASANELDGSILVGDILSGLIPSMETGGWHPANPASGNSMDPNGLPAFTDDVGAIGGLSGLLNDFPDTGNPAIRSQ